MAQRHGALLERNPRLHPEVLGRSPSLEGRSDIDPSPSGSGGSPMTPAGTATARAHRTRKRTRIQEANEEKILDAALEVFSSYGFRGATIDQIAAVAGMTKPNLLYYFRCKEDVYIAVLNRTLEMWLQPLEALDP